MIDKTKNTVKHSTERTSNNSEHYNRFFQTKGTLTIHQFEKHLKK